MAKPMSAAQFVSALRKEGVPVSESYSGWRTHNRNHKGAWGPVNGVVIHHTAGRDSKSLCYNGTAALPGPLCHTHLAKNGTATMMSAGRANHAGSFPQNAFNAMVSEASKKPRPSGPETVDANSRTYGIEIENLGNNKDPYPQKQYDVAVRWAAAICRFHGWSANSVIGHKEGTTRKIDPTFSMDQFRKDVAARLAGKAGDGGKVTAPGSGGGSSNPSKPSVARYQVTIDGKKYGYGAKGSHITKVGQALVRKGFGKHYKEGPGPNWTDADTKNYALYQKSLGFSGKDADGVPGANTLRKLLGTAGGGAYATVSLSKLVKTAKSDPKKVGNPVSYSGAKVVEKALQAEGVLAAKYVDGHFGTLTVNAYKAWQKRCGYSGADADGIPGSASLKKLGAKHGFKVSG